MSDPTNLILFSQMKPGDRVKFFVNDSFNVITGKVLAIANYDVAKAMQVDIAARHASIQAADIENNRAKTTNVIDDVFVILDVGETRPTVIEKSWISDKGIYLVDKCSDYKIVLKNCTKKEAIEALNLLRINNIACSFDVLN